MHYIQLHEEQIVNDRMNKRKKTTLARENQLSKNLNSFYDLPYDLQQNLTVKTAFEIGNISTVIRLSNSVFNSFVNPVITTEEELVNITLSFDD